MNVVPLKKRQKDRKPPKRYKLTPDFISKLQWSGKPKTYADSTVIGLRVEVNEHSKSFKVQKDLRVNGKSQTIRMTLGSVEQHSLRDARTWAMGIVAKIRAGEDPRGAQPGRDLWTLAEMLEERQADMRIRERAPRTIQDEKANVERHLGDWLALPITEITRSMCRERHRDLSERCGKTMADRVMQALSRGSKLAERVLDVELPRDPTVAVTFNKVPPKRRRVDFDELVGWWERAQSIQNPIRREMHTLALLSGLRPGKLASIERAWIDLDRRCISIPAMKRKGAFDLPLSEPMCDIVRRTLAAGDMLYPGTRWLIQGRGRGGRTTTWREKKLPKKTGHFLRHVHRTVAQRVGLNPIDAALLIDHSIKGIARIYVHQEALFSTLLERQERVSAEFLKLLGAESNGNGEP